MPVHGSAWYWAWHSVINPPHRTHYPLLNHDRAVFLLARICLRFIAHRQLHKRLVLNRIFAFIGTATSRDACMLDLICAAEIIVLPTAITFGRLFHCSSNVHIGVVAPQSSIMIVDNSGVLKSSSV